MVKKSILETFYKEKKEFKFYSTIYRKQKQELLNNVQKYPNDSRVASSDPINFSRVKARCCLISRDRTDRTPINFGLPEKDFWRELDLNELNLS